VIDVPESHAAAEAGNSVPDMYRPYADLSVDFIYNLLFCDDVALFRSNDGAAPGEPWRTLLQEPPDPRALRVMIADEANESRLRALACHRLQATGAQVAEKRLFGVIIEVPLSQGLDVLAAFADGQVRHIDHTGKMSYFEPGPDEVNARARRIVASAQPLVEQLGRHTRTRQPPPGGDRIRMSFLASDGLYVGEGRYDAMQKDAHAGPVLAAALSLLRTASSQAGR